MEPRLREALGLIEKLTLAPDDVVPGDVDRLRAAGLSEAAIVDVIFVCAGFNAIDRVADALDFYVPPDFRPGAPVVLKLGYWWMSGTWPAAAPPSGRPRKEALFRRLEEAVLHASGTLESGIRAAIAEDRDPPEPLRAYVEKVRRHAYKVTDDDVAAIRAAGYGEDQIYEATLAAAVGAARKRLERGLSALDARSRVDPDVLSA